MLLHISEGKYRGQARSYGENTSSAMTMLAKRPWTRGSSGKSWGPSGFPQQGGPALPASVPFPWS